MIIHWRRYENRLVPGYVNVLARFRMLGSGRMLNIVAYPRLVIFRQDDEIQPQVIDVLTQTATIGNIAHRLDHFITCIRHAELEFEMRIQASFRLELGQLFN